MSANLERCAGCGALVPRGDGPTHPYIGASPGCWAIYGEVLARDYGEEAAAPVLQLAVDAYAAQHPGTPSRRSTQSVAVHLIILCLAFERGYDPARATEARRRALAHRQDYVWLDPPASLGPLTILDAHQARDLAEHAARVERWARSVWETWAPHHETVRRWASL